MAQAARISDTMGSTRIGSLTEVGPGVHLLPGFGNSTILVGRTGAAVVDPGAFENGPRVVEAVRALTDQPVRYIVYTHGHLDHAFGTPALLEDASDRGHPEPVIVGHVNVARRFTRYRRTTGYLATTYDVQFASWTPSGGNLLRNARYFPPTLEYEDRLSLSLGDLTLQCRHGLGETDDHTWVWVPERRVVVGGDFIVSSLPNAGTPFRVQRYVLEWAEALEEMAGLDPLAVVSGHGGVYRADAVEMLLTTARALRWLEDEVVLRLNRGQGYEQIVCEVELPTELAASPYLQPVYGCPAFAVHSILRRYRGWYDGNASHLFPSPTSAIASEVLTLSGGAGPLLDRAKGLGQVGDVDSVQLALHLVDFVLDGSPDGPERTEARVLKGQLLYARAELEPSFISHNILESAAVLEGGSPKEGETPG